MFEFISKAVVAVSLAIGSWFAPTPLDIPAVDPSIEHDRAANRVAQLESLGAYNPTGAGTYRLKTSIGTTNTTISLSSFKEPVSEIPYTMTYLNTSIAYGTLDPVNSTRSEFISFTGITQNADGSATLTGVTRGLSRSYPYTASSTLRQAHGGQSIFILSDSPQHFSEYAVKRNDEIITGQWTFTNFPITASTSYASETVIGAVELATGQEAASSTASSTVARLALSTAISTSTAPSSGHVVPVTQSNGRLDSGFIVPSWSTSTTYSTAGTYTWTNPSATSGENVLIEVWGAGGSGGARSSSDSGGAGGGGGGLYAHRIMRLSDISGTVSIYVGAGGALVSGNTSGNDGKRSYFGAYVISYGGSGGVTSGLGGSGGASWGTSTAATTSAALYGLGYGSNDYANQYWGNGLYSGGGGGGISGLANEGGKSIYGGAGGAGFYSTGEGSGGTSIHGGNGGASLSNGAGTAGSVCGGGGGASGGGNSGAGGDGCVKITVW